MADKKISELTNYTTPLDADVVPIVDNANLLTKKTTWANIKATLKTYFDTLYTFAYTPEDNANKVTSVSGASTNTQYPSAKLLYDQLALKATLTGAETLTNKRVTPRVTSETSSATPTINTDNTDIHRITAQTVDITSFTTNLSGTPTHGQSLLIEITGTASRAITWGASFEASTTALPTTTSGTNTLTVGFKWNTATSKWRCLASG